MMVVNCAVITGLLTWRSSMHCTTLPDLSLYLYCANNLQTASTTFSFCLTTVTADWASFPKRIHRNKWSIFLQTVHFLSPTEQSQIQRRSPKAKNQNQQHQRTEGNKKALLLTSSITHWISHFSSSRGKLSWDVSIWDIPISIKNCSSLYSFKRHLKSYFIAQLTNN